MVTLFPTGRVTTLPQAVLLRLIAGVGLVVSIALAVDVPAAQDGRHNPIGIPAVEPFTSFVVNRGFAIVPLLLLASLVSLACVGGAASESSGCSSAGWLGRWACAC